MINIFFLMYIIYFLTDKIIMNSNKKISLLTKKEEVKIMVGIGTYYVLNMRDITLIQKEENHYCIYFKKDTLNIITTEGLLDNYPKDYQDILRDSKIKLDSRFKDKDMIQLKNICLEINHSKMDFINKERKIVPFEKHFSNNVYESISQWNRIASFIVIIYITFNYFKVIELFTDNKLVIISSYISINMIGYGISYLILKRILKTNKNHMLHFTNEDGYIYYLNKETNTEVHEDVMDISYIREEMNGYVFIMNNGSSFAIDKRYSKSSMQRIFSEINKKNHTIQYY